MSGVRLSDVINNIINIYDPKQMDDTIFGVNVLTKLLQAKGLIKDERGFYNAGIDKHFIAKKPNNIKSFQGDTTLDFSHDNYYKTLSFNSKAVIGTMYFTDKELHAFKSNPKDLKVSQSIRDKLDLLIKSMGNKIEAMLWGDGTGNNGLDIDGLAYYLPEGTSEGRYTAGTIGGLARADYENLQHYCAIVNNPDTELVPKMESVFKVISAAMGIDEPDIIIMAPEVHDKYLALAGDETISDRALGIAELSWVTTRFKGKPVVWANALAGTGRIYMLNSNYIEFLRDPDAWFEEQEHKPFTQRGTGYSYLCVANLIIYNLKRQAVIKVNNL